MPRDYKAIDYMNYVSLPEFMKRWQQAKKDELVCRMEASLGSDLPGVDIDAFVNMMDSAGVDKVFITQNKMFSYWNKWMYMDTKLEEVRQYTEKYPQRFVGLAGYNPFRIKDSLNEIERSVKEYGFKGVYIHIYGFDMSLIDNRMYPLYAKCTELDIPVSIQVGYVLEAMPSEHGRPIYLDRIALDFPTLKIIGSHTGYPWCEELISICYKYDNVYFGADAHMPRYWEPTVVRFIQTRGQDKVIWGSNGLPWDRMFAQIDALQLSEEVQRKLLRDNAMRVFGL